MRKTILSILVMTGAFALGFPTGPALAQYDSLRGTCFLSNTGNFNCTAWDVTARENGRHGGSMEIIEMHPDRTDVPMFRVFALYDNTFIVEEHDGNTGQWYTLYDRFYADAADPECVLGGPNMDAICFRPY